MMFHRRSHCIYFFLKNSGKVRETFVLSTEVSRMEGGRPSPRVGEGRVRWGKKYFQMASIKMRSNKHKDGVNQKRAYYLSL